MTDTYVVDAKSGKATILKDPDAVLDYTFNWQPWVDDIADSIASASVPVIAPTGAVQPGSALALDLTAPHTSGFQIIGKTVAIWLKLGAAGTTYQVTCRVVTTGGRIDDRSIYVKIKDR